MRWTEKPLVLDDIINAYVGVEKGARQFIWEEANGDLVVGNARAFTDHLSRKHSLNLTVTDWSSVHEVLRLLGEVTRGYTPRKNKLGKKFVNSEPKIRVLRKGPKK